MSSSIFAHAAPVANLSFSHILPEQVETLGHVNALVMDAQGFMWFGGSSGLARYDGLQLVYYRSDFHKPGSLPSNTVNQLVVSRDGTLWLATERGIARYNPATDDFTAYHRDSRNGENSSSDAVRAMLEDMGGGFWLATAAGLVHFDPASGSFSPARVREPVPVDPGRLNLWSLDRDDQGHLWLASQDAGLVRYDPARGELELFSHARGGLTPDDDVRAVLVDKDDRVWIGTYTGHLERLLSDGSGFERFSYGPEARLDAVWALRQDRSGNLWVGDGVGLGVLAPGSDQLQRYMYQESEPSSPGNYTVRIIYEDHTGDLWFGYFPSGVDRLDRLAPSFRNFRHDPREANSLTDGGVLSVAEDGRQNLWIGTGRGLSYFDRKAQRFTRFFHRPNDPGSLSGDTALSLLLDRQGELWVGSWSKGLNRMDPSTGRVLEHYDYQPDNASSLLGKEPWRLLEDSRGDIWVATELGVSRYNRASNDFTRFVPEAGDSGESRLYVRELYEDRQHNLWVGSDRGLLRLDRDSGRYTLYANQSGDSRSLSANFVQAVFQDSRGRLWVGTHGGGLNLFDTARGEFTAFGMDDGLPDPVVTSITEDSRGYLWLSTQKGLSRFDTDAGEFKNFDKRHGLLGNVFNRNTALRTSWGELFFGDTKGFVLIDPLRVASNAHVPPVVITDLQIFNRPVVIGADNSPLTSAINVSDKITLNHRQSVFSLGFAALNYHLPERNQFAYRLEGFDADWLYVGSRRSATYTNLDPGKYTFRVKAANDDGLWNEEGASLQVEILPPPWRTWWAYSLYALLALTFCTALYQSVLRKMQLRQEKTLNTKLVKLDKVKDAFLANTSHELRTPLNGIIGIADALMHGASGPLSAEVVNKLTLISASGKRLASLVNDILDYSKLSEQSLNIRVKPVNLSALVGQVCFLLQQLADDKGLKLYNDVRQETHWVMADENRLQQILLNLMGNAIKYTPAGSVRVAAKTGGGQVRISVTDTGIGIAREDLASVFAAFHQLESSDSREHSGTGLGLAITKQLVELHGGQIEVASTLGRGSTFTVCLPVANALREAAEGASSPAARPRRRRHDQQDAQETAPDQKDATLASRMMIEHAESYRILVVDDDPVNRIVLNGILKLHHYQVLEASSGQEALERIEAEGPVDLVVLDVMMPRMSGFDLCQLLRQRYDLHQLPVIFLTAKKLDDDLKKGYEVGGNSFLTKPVSKYELLPQVANLLKLKSLAGSYPVRPADGDHPLS